MSASETEVSGCRSRGTDMDARSDLPAEVGRRSEKASAPGGRETSILSAAESSRNRSRVEADSGRLLSTGCLAGAICSMLGDTPDRGDDADGAPSRNVALRGIPNPVGAGTVLASGVTIDIGLLDDVDGLRRQYAISLSIDSIVGGSCILRCGGAPSAVPVAYGCVRCVGEVKDAMVRSIPDSSMSIDVDCAVKFPRAPRDRPCMSCRGGGGSGNGRNPPSGAANEVSPAEPHVGPRRPCLPMSQSSSGAAFVLTVGMGGVTRLALFIPAWCASLVKSGRRSARSTCARPLRGGPVEEPESSCWSGVCGRFAAGVAYWFPEFRGGAYR